MRSLTTGLVVPGGGGGGAPGAGAPTDAKYIVQTAHGDLSAEQALSTLATGIVKNTNGTGVLSIAAEGTDYYAPGGTDVAVADGGTGAGDASTARTNLGVAIGVNVQAYSANLDEYAAVNPTAAGLALLDDATAADQRTTLGAAAATHTHTLADITDDGTMAAQNANNVAITGGAITGITDLAIADGGTGASTAAGARTNLGVGPVSTPYCFGQTLAASITAPADNVNHYLVVDGGAVTTAPSVAGATVAVVRQPCTITDVYFFLLVSGTNGTAETGSVMIRVNNTTDTTVFNNTIAWNVGATGALHTATGLSIALAAGDWFTVKIDPPTWATNPTNVWYQCSVITTTP